LSEPDVLAGALALGLADAEALLLGLALPLALALALAVSVGLALALAPAVPVPWDAAGVEGLGSWVTAGLVGGLDDAADAVGLGVLDFAAADRDGDGDDDGHATPAEVELPGVALPSTPLAPEARPEPPVLAKLGGLLCDPANTSVLTWTNA
jgi:hypothetical protein